MRLLLLLLVLGGCRIPGDHFIGIGGGDDAGGGDDGAMVDAPPAIPAGHGYVFEDSNNAANTIKRVSKDPVGNLTLDPGGGTALALVKVALVRPDGARLFVGTDTGITMYTIGSGAVLGSPVTRTITGCSPRGLALHPSGNYLAVGCATGGFGVLRLVNGEVTTSATFQTTMVVALPNAQLQTVAFNPAGTCLFVADKINADTTLMQTVFGYTFDVGGGVLGSPSPAPGPNGPAAMTVDPTGTSLFVAGPNDLQSYSLAGTGCSPSASHNAALAPGASNVPAMVMTSSGSRLFVAVGMSIYVFDIGGIAITPVTGTPSTFSTLPDIRDLALDPALPDVLYVTIANQARPMAVSPQGVVSIGSNVVTAGNNNVGFVLAP